MLVRDKILKEQKRRIEFIVGSMALNPTKKNLKRVATAVSRGLGLTDAGTDVRNSMPYAIAKAFKHRKFKTIKELRKSVWLSGFSDTGIGATLRKFPWFTDIKIRGGYRIQKPMKAEKKAGNIGFLKVNYDNADMVRKSKTSIHKNRDELLALQSEMGLLRGKLISSELEVIRLKGMVKNLSRYL